jgi:hypothetical protein
MNLDIWRLISLYLPFNHLNINKEIGVLYDRSWFKDKLVMKYGDINGYDYEWLYKRSLKSGQIYKYDEDKNKVKKLLSDEAIKISEIEAEWILSLEEDFEGIKIYMMLTFNGNLYSFRKFKKYISKLTLIDTNVIDIDNNTYIKKDEWYVYPERKTNKITDKRLVSDATGFLAVASTDNFICAITKDHFYCYGLGTGNLRTYEWTDNVNLVFSGDFLILKLDGSLIKYNPRPDSSTVVDIRPVKDIYPGCVKLSDGSYKAILKNHPDDISFHDININNLTNSIFNCGSPMLLANNNVHSTKNLNDITLIHENVKNICGTFDIFFII